jgi:Tfp pilus assembly protein PilX
MHRPLWHTEAMKIAKPLLMVTTPIGVLAGLYECVRLAGGLVIVMLAMVGVMLAALATVIATIRREARPAKTAAQAAATAAECAVTNTPGVICKS